MRELSLGIDFRQGISNSHAGNTINDLRLTYSYFLGESFSLNTLIWQVNAILVVSWKTKQVLTWYWKETHIYNSPGCVLKYLLSIMIEVPSRMKGEGSIVSVGSLSMCMCHESSSYVN